VTRLEEARQAALAASAFWAALAREDDEALGRLVVPGTIRQTSGFAPGFAATFREAIGRTRDECMMMGLIALPQPGGGPKAIRVGAYRDGSYLVKTTPRLTIGEEIVVAEGRMARLYPTVVVPLDGEWRVWGPPDGRSGQEIVEWVDVPWIDSNDAPSGPVC
jgi:hypothetical protein